MLPGYTLDQAAAPDATLTALVISVALGLLVLVPSLWYLYRLVLRGKLDQELRAARSALPSSDWEPGKE